MQYELKTQVIEPLRQTFTPLIERYGNKPATRYQEGTIGLQPVENFHYRPTWDSERELYDPNYSALKLTDPYSYTDPRQYYYTPYVTNRAAMHDAFGKTLDYVTNHGLLERTPADWQQLIAEVIIPLRHYESGAQMLYSNACRFSYGATIAQCCGYESFDRIGNAQLISRVGIALGQQTADILKAAKALWIGAPSMQGLRSVEERLLVEQDWAVGVIGLDLVDELVDALVYRYLDEEAILGGAGAYSLLAQHIGTWWTEHRKWLDPLYKEWIADEQYGAANTASIEAAVNTWLPQALAAVKLIASRADELAGTASIAAVEEHAVAVADRFRGLGMDITDPMGA
ncbi:Phenol hydroxylase P1 protein [Raineyella antarctica]|uniref:propane 2-monooxygenase n=1 Tax=Raineyella antarctica TaxID=1577474 RepID=A0A1G6GEU5_9ACTN|nr:phenol 2-monooxygenase [Raineyella antarctica]SDB80490.1 Phenol hydroxylase P1 protein [Raineyella antarctica]